MLFMLSKIFMPLIQPDLILLAAILVGLALTWTRRWRAGRRIAMAGALLSFAVAIIPVGDWLLAPLEERFPPPREMPARVDGIIVLGGAINADQTAKHDIPSLNQHAERMTSFVKLARLYPSAKLVFTAGSASIFTDRPKEADGAKMLFTDLGLDASKIMFERESRNTYENAIFSKRLVSPQPGEIWVLITSASHMPRSVGIFRRAGWPVIPYPVAYKAGKPYDLTLAGHFSEIDLALHEWVGLASYWLLGRTDALFPSP